MKKKTTTPSFRPFVPSDRDSLAKHADNIKVWNNLRDHLPNPYTLADADSFIAHCSSQSPPTDFAIDISGNTVGVIGYIPRTDVERISAEIGYWVGEEFWNRGIATKVLTDFTNYIFRETNLVHLFAIVFSTNPASMRVLEKAGFNFVGKLHRAAVKNGKIIDLHIYEKLKS